MRVPDGWCSITLGDFISLQRGYDLPAQNRKEGAIPIIGGGGINGFHSEAKVKGPGIVIGRSGAGFGTAFYSEVDFWSHNTGLFVTDFHNNFPKFVFHYLVAFDFKKYNSGGAQPSLNRNFIYPIKIIVPPLSEQIAITDLLSTWDTAIEKIERLIASKAKQLSAYGQQLFNPKAAIKKNGWEKVRLSKVLTEHRDLSSGDETVFSVSVHKSLVNQIEHLGRSFSASDTSKYNRVHCGDIVYTRSPTGNFPYGIVKQSAIIEDVIVSPLYGVFKPQTIELGTILDFYFESPVHARNYLYPIIQKGAKNTINITNKTFLSAKLHLPLLLKEQKKVSELVVIARNEIDLLKKQVEAFRKQKRGLMQRLLTGKWRVKIKEE